MDPFSLADLTVIGLSVVLIVAAIIDGWLLKVPNWLTFPLILSGWAYWGMVQGWSGLAMSLAGTAVGMGLLLLPYSVGGMGAGDVKLLGGVGAWMGAFTTLGAFCVSALVGGAIALAMIAWHGSLRRNARMFKQILVEFAMVGSFTTLAEVAGARKSRMMLLPYGIPLAIGTIGYLVWTGILCIG